MDKKKEREQKERERDQIRIKKAKEIIEKLAGDVGVTLLNINLNNPSLTRKDVLEIAGEVGKLQHLFLDSCL